MGDAVQKIDLAVRLALFAGAGYAVYQMVKAAQAQAIADAAEGQAGVPKDWLNDPILQRHARDQLQTPQLYPRCQIFDTRYQFFLDAGDTEANASQDACFVKMAPMDNPRYLKDASSEPVFMKEDPLAEDPSFSGTCYFRLPDGTFQTFPDFGKPDAPLIPVNRSARLCFASGETLEDAGYSFKNASTGLSMLNPFYNASEVLEKTVLPGPPYCEQFNDYSDSNGTTQGWFYNSANSNSQSQCLQASTLVNPTRWRTASLLIFQNPHTGEEVALKNEVY